MSKIPWNDNDEWKRDAIARNGTLASELSRMLDERYEGEMERIVLFDLYNNAIGDYTSLSEMPAVDVGHRFYAWSENWAYYDHGDSSMPSRPDALPRHPTAQRDP